MPLRNQEDADSPAVNASSSQTTTADGKDTHGIVNQHPAAAHHGTAPFRVGVSEDRNKRWRRTMEDSHAFVYDFGGVPGQGFFGVFDGHAGKHSAEWCGQHFHEYLLDTLASNSSKTVPDVFNLTFHAVDERLSELADKEGTSSGCTAVTVFLRLEDENGRPVQHAQSGGVRPKQGAADSAPAGETPASPKKEDESKGGLLGWARRMRHPSSGSGEGEAAAASAAAAATSNEPPATAAESKTPAEDKTQEQQQQQQPSSKSAEPEQASKSSTAAARRVLYTANVGDARAVLCRGGKAVRLTYDHKGSDAQEAKRITDAGGFVMNNRVNGVLAVTRSLGDAAMKEFVVGSPYTTETSLSEDDTLLIVACDGLWDVVDDQDAVDLVANVEDPQEASEMLLQHALSNFSTDNLSVLVIRMPTSNAAAVDAQPAPGEKAGDSQGVAQSTGEKFEHQA